MAAKSKRKQAGQAPISSHPAFPAIVALWFAALFGMGSLVLPVLLLEKLVTVTGIAALVPAAAPPLGVTARMLIALVAAGLGVAIGIVLARRVAAAQSEARETRRAPKLRGADSHPDAPAKRPISALEELGSDRLDEPVGAEDYRDNTPRGEPIPGRRRPLSVTDERGRSEFLDHAPLPGMGMPYGPPAGNEDDAFELGGFADEEEAAEPPIPDVAMPLRNSEIAAQAATDTAERPFERAFDAPVAALATVPGDAQIDTSARAEQTAPAAPLALAEEGYDMAEDAPTGPEFAASRPFAAPLDQPRAAPADTVSSAPQADTPARPETARPAIDPAIAPLAQLTVAQLVERFAGALESHRAALAHAGPPAAAPAMEEPVPFISQRRATSEPVPAAPAPLADAPVADAEVALERNRYTPFAAPASLPPFDDAAETGSPRTEAEVAHHPETAPPMPFARPPEPIANEPVEHDLQMPRALQPLDLELEGEEIDGEEEDFAPLSLQLSQASRQFDRPDDTAAAEQGAMPDPWGVAKSADEEENEDENEYDDDSAEGGYSSLLDMKRPLGGGQEFVRIDEDDNGSADGEAAEPMVVFPNAGHAPAPKQPANPARPFDQPQGDGSGVRNGGLGTATPTNPPMRRADPSETEKALREALEKLQRMSGAA